MALLEIRQFTAPIPVAHGPRAGEPLFREMSLTLEPGQTLALIGPSGTGKTTLLYYIAGLHTPPPGAVFWQGLDLASLPERRRAQLRREAIAMVFQNDLCHRALSVWENAALGLRLNGTARREARSRAEAMLERVGLAGWAGRKTAELSGGQRQRLGLARALLSRAQLYLLDEPTSDLDARTAEEIRALLFAHLKIQNAAALIVTHDPVISQTCDATLALEDGCCTDKKTAAGI